MSRIITGRARGTRLRSPVGSHTRPTTDRVREALFSALTAWADGAGAASDRQLAGLSLLDLYAGSGAIGVEAASRGARPVVCVENHRPTVAVIRRNIAVTGLADQVRVCPVPVQTFLAGSPQPFDVVWLDPPYELAAGVVDAVVARLLTGWLAADGMVVVERSRRGEAVGWPAMMAETWNQRHGETELYFARRALNESQGES